MKTKKIFYFLLPTIALILEILPFGAVLNFANPDGGPLRRTFSYFDLTPYGYGNVGPFFTSLFTCGMIFCLAAHFFSGKKVFLTLGKYLGLSGFAASLFPIMLGLHYFSLLGGAISFALAANVLLLFFFPPKTNS